MRRVDCPRVWLISDPSLPDEQLVERIDSIAATFRPGSLAVLVRDKLRHDDAVAPLARSVRELCSHRGALMLLGDRRELAAAVGADGVHFGGSSRQSLADHGRPEGATVVSVPAHDEADVVAAMRDGADVALVSPIFSTMSGGQPKRARGFSALSAAREVCNDRLCVVALGGVTARSAAQCLEHGADGVALIGALILAPDPRAAARALAQALGVVR